MQENEISAIIIDCALKIHKILGPGLFENVYETALEYELQNHGLYVQTQVPIPLVYEAIKLEAGYRVDILVENKVIIEIKSIEAIAPVHRKQLLTYLRPSNKKLGLLINFNVEFLKDGIIRLVNNL
ncbi:MAG: GxxExxY protein [Candidatus Kapabacteria bacterium]|nr:GxxExxY protein [Candidatus Kapabacteria bacterium]